MNKLLLTLALGAACLSVQAADGVGKPGAAQGKVAMCIGCHGIQGYRSSFPEVYSVPKLGGQSAGYIVAALKEYQKGDRKHPTMRGIAASLSEQDMADIAAYYAQQTAETPANRVK
ncbi:MAG: cytochrome c [Candidatus Protistobacter heckmanni]|nr:cytochrome c [Candidatus Protistobacter heckmanni]